MGPPVKRDARWPLAGPARDDRADLAERRARAFEEPFELRPVEGSPYPILEVRNPIHGTHYRVWLPEYPARASALCSCADFARRGLGSCKHVEAALRWLGFRPERARPSGLGPPIPTGLWEEIDRRLAELPSAAGPRARAWRVPGEALIGPAEPEARP